MTDVIGIGVLTRLVNRDLVDEVLETTGKRERRERLLPARVVVYYAMALTLFYGEAYEEVVRRFVAGLEGLRAWRSGWRVDHWCDLAGTGPPGLGAAARAVRASGSTDGPDPDRRWPSTATGA